MSSAPAVPSAADLAAAKAAQESKDAQTVSSVNAKIAALFSSKYPKAAVDPSNDDVVANSMMKEDVVAHGNAFVGPAPGQPGFPPKLPAQWRTTSEGKIVHPDGTTWTSVKNASTSESAGVTSAEKTRAFVPRDPKFPYTNQMKYCWYSFVKYHACQRLAEKDPSKAGECAQYKTNYTTLCPQEKIEAWEDQKAEGIFAGPAWVNDDWKEE